MAFRVTRIFAALALVASLAGIFPSVAIIRTNSGSGLDGRLLWMLVPILSAGVVFLLAPGRRLEPVWVLIGMSWGFVVAAAWSLGLFFAPSALLLLIAGFAHLMAIRPTWWAVLIPAWFLAGASGVCAMFFARDQLLAMSRGGQITEAPAIVAGTRLFVALVVFLAATQVAARVLRPRTAG
jgi:hypothetical protein